jgi:CRP-like cAMP-binding protein
MNQAARRGHPDIRIRAVKAWTPEHGRESTHLTLSASDKAELSRLAEIIEYKTVGSQILFQGQKASFLYLLADGVVGSNHILNCGDRQIVSFYWPGDLFGLAEKGVYVNSAEALTPCVVYRFPIGKLEQFLLDNPKVQHSFVIKAVHDLRSAQRQLVAMGRFDIARRLAIFLLDCSGHEHYFDLAAQALTVPMTRYHIADYLGTSAESVTRAFGLLESKGLLHRLTARTLELKLAELRTFVDAE